MSHLTAEQRGDLAEAMVPVAANLAVLVNGDGGPDDIAASLAHLNDDQRNALIIVLAAMVNPDHEMPPSAHWPADTITPRQIADEHDHADDTDVALDVDEVAVERWLNGDPIDLNPRERVAAIVEGKRRGLNYPDLDAVAGQKRGTTAAFVSMVRRAAPALAVPDPFGYEDQAAFDDDTIVRIREAAAAGRTDLELSLSFGVTRRTITAIANGSSYPMAGGPIRPKRVNKPNEGTLLGFVRNASSTYATAS